MSMRITRANIEALVDVLDRFADDGEALWTHARVWLDGQDEEPKTEEVRETIRDARTGLEEGIEPFARVVAEIARLLDVEVDSA